jgi:hypothetical protein
MKFLGSACVKGYTYLNTELKMKIMGRNKYLASKWKNI